MSVFTNPAGSAPAHAQQYVSAVLALLGDTPPLRVLETTAGLLRKVRATLSASELVQPEADGKWSVRHVLQHLADSEMVWGVRLRMTLAQERPPLAGYDQDAWAERLVYADADAALALFETLRRANLVLLELATAADLQRVAVHAERGEQTLEQMVRLCAGHDLLHLNQIERITARTAP
jgi:uncharacterized damage-inducible protein DinB